jgi:hypothetical protein
VFDCVGNKELYRRSVWYLKADGVYVDIALGPFGKYQINNWWPVILGGTPRKMVAPLCIPSGNQAREVAEWVEKGWVKEIPIDSTFEMDSAVQVSWCIHRAYDDRDTETARRPLKRWNLDELWARSSSRSTEFHFMRLWSSLKYPCIYSKVESGEVQSQNTVCSGSQGNPNIPFIAANLCLTWDTLARSFCQFFPPSSPSQSSSRSTTVSSG